MSVLPANDGWSADLRLGFRLREGKTLLAQRSHKGPLAVQRPFYPESGVCHVYVLHPPGGVVGGDGLRIGCDLEEGCQALATTPGATKFYRSTGAIAHQTQEFSVADTASLEWLPQENIFFPGARVKMTTRVQLEGRARLMLWEKHCLGRPSISEPFEQGTVDSCLEIYRDGRPLLLDRLRVDGASRLRRSHLAGRPVIATSLFTPATEADLLDARACFEADGKNPIAATLIEDLLVIRYLGESTEQAGRLFQSVWERLRPSLLQRQPAAPRIWNT